jgi:3-methylcrotonyl-CoA carboxylase alpha subunit
VIEEAPAPDLPEEMRRLMGGAAVKAAAAVGYEGAGTVEFIADASRGLRPDRFFFMEMNTRLQVEHPVTEALTGLDLVEWQLRVAAGEPLPLAQDRVPLQGHAVEARIYAEDPAENFRPSTGRLWAATFPAGDGIRVDSGVEEGSVVGPFYDSMLAKVIASGSDRGEALERLAAALGEVRIAGPRTNLGFLSAIATHPEFRSGAPDTGFVDREIGHLVGSSLDRGLAAPAVAEWLSNEARELARAAPGPWARSDGFELGGLERRSRVDVHIDGEAVPVEVAWASGGPKLLTIAGEAPPEVEPSEVIWGEGEAFILHRRGQLQVAFPDPLARDLASVDGGGEVVAPMHGRVVAVSVAAGDQVTKGDLLFTVEAMKMEHGVVAPASGTVREVRVAPGTQIDQGAVGVSIEAETGAPESARSGE